MSRLQGITGRGHGLRLGCLRRVACGRLRNTTMSDVIDSEGFRANVGIILMRGAGEVFLGRRTGGRGWQFPQGGVRRGEELEQALYRELHEEVGVAKSDVSLLGQTD